MAFWLSGASKIITIDLNPYLKTELVEESVYYIRKNIKEIENLFGPLLIKERLDQIIKLSEERFVLKNILELCSIEYIAPGDASNTNLADESIDYFTSNAVFEHIPPDVLRKIILEGNRMIRNDGLFVNYIDYKDHFSSKDPAISAINFLQFSDSEWNKYAGNKYMYMNRLRHDDYISLFENLGHDILASNSSTDSKSLFLLNNQGIHIDDKFKHKANDILAIREALIVTRKQKNLL